MAKFKKALFSTLESPPPVSKFPNTCKRKKKKTFVTYLLTKKIKVISSDKQERLFISEMSRKKTIRNLNIASYICIPKQNKKNCFKTSFATFITDLEYLYLCDLQKTRLQNIPKMSTLSNPKINSHLDKQNRTKNDSKHFPCNEIFKVTYVYSHDLQNLNLQTENNIFCNLQIKTCFNQQGNPPKK